MIALTLHQLTTPKKRRAGTWRKRMNSQKDFCGSQTPMLKQTCLKSKPGQDSPVRNWRKGAEYFGTIGSGKVADSVLLEEESVEKARIAANA